MQGIEVLDQAALSSIGSMRIWGRGDRVGRRRRAFLTARLMKRMIGDVRESDRKGVRDYPRGGK
jgi:hypothetical protein